MKRKDPNPNNAKTTIFIVLITATYTIAAAVGAVWVQSSLTNQAQANTEQRTVQRATYLEFVDRANTYDFETTDMRICINASAQKNGIEMSGQENLRRLAALAVSDCNGLHYVHSRNVFQDSINKVYLDGSKDAITIARQIAGQLPSSRGDYTDKYGLPPIEQILNKDSSKFSDYFIVFLDQMCVDVRATNKDVCLER